MQDVLPQGGVGETVQQIYKNSLWLRPPRRVLSLDEAGNRRPARAQRHV